MAASKESTAGLVACEELYPHLERAGFSGISPRKSITSGQSVVYVVHAWGRDKGPGLYAIKRFLKAGDHGLAAGYNSRRSVREQFEAYRRFYDHRIRIGDFLVRCPEPLLCDEESMLMVMSYEEGPTLDQWLGHGGRTTREVRAMASCVARGLHLYHTINGQYGSFHPGHIILTPRSEMVMIDFTTPEPFYHLEHVRGREFYPASGDLGYCVFNTLATNLKRLVTAPLFARRRLLWLKYLTEFFEREYVQPARLDEFRMEVRSSCKAHIKRLAQMDVRNRMLAYALECQRRIIWV